MLSQCHTGIKNAKRMLEIKHTHQYSARVCLMSTVARTILKILTYVEWKIVPAFINIMYFFKCRLPGWIFWQGMQYIM